MENCSIFMKIPSQQCPVGRNIHHVLDDKLQQVQNALENELQKITLADVFKDTKYYIDKEVSHDDLWVYKKLMEKIHQFFILQLQI